jgi:hypothetical protein
LIFRLYYGKGNRTGGNFLDSFGLSACDVLGHFDEDSIRRKDKKIIFIQWNKSIKIGVIKIDRCDINGKV